MASPAANYRSLDILIDELDVRADQPRVGDTSEDFWVCQRKHPRHIFRTECRIWFVQTGMSQPVSLPGRTRNLSRNGIGLLTRRPFQIGEPAEVEIVLPSHPTSYVAGLVTFCRYAGRGFYEIGISLRVAGREPLFSQNPSVAVHNFDWFRTAVAQK